MVDGAALEKWWAMSLEGSNPTLSSFLLVNFNVLQLLKSVQEITDHCLAHCLYSKGGRRVGHMTYPSMFLNAYIDLYVLYHVYYLL